MGLAKKFKKIMIDKELKVSDLAKLANIDSKVLSVKLSRDTLTVKSAEQLAEALNCEIILKDRDTKKEY